MQLIDYPNESQTDGATVDAEIDAVGAISSIFESAIFKGREVGDPPPDNAPRL
jgi:hypothetical protein